MPATATTKVLDLPAVPPFSITDTASLSQRWGKWKKSLEYFMAASGITDQKQKRAVLLHLAGPEVQDIFETLTETGEDYDTAIAKLTEHFEPQKNISFERHTFRQTVQEQGETIDHFVTRLKYLVKTCEYDKPDDMIRDQIIDKCVSTHLRRRLLRETDLTLAKVLSIARSLEASDQQASQMENVTGQVNALQLHNASNPRSRHRASKRGPSSVNKPRGGTKSVCFCCGNPGHRAKDPTCPANGKACNNCRKIGHFSRVCKQGKRSETSKDPRNATREIRSIQDTRVATDFSDDEYLFVAGTQQKMQPIIAKIASVPVELIVDSGASVNVLDNATFTRLNKDNMIQLKPTPLRLFAYGSTTPLSVQGSFVAKIQYGQQTVSDTFLVVANETSGSLMGRPTAVRLGLFGDHDEINQISAKPEINWVDRHPEVFRGVGKLKNFQLKLHIDDSVLPVAQPPRRLPFHIRKAVVVKVEELEKLDIIEPVDGPTPWVSPLVAVPKPNGDVRVCVDMRQANTAIVRERHPIPTIEDILQELQGARVFSKLDLRWGYHQIELHPDSRPITTFATHKGLYRYKRLMFGVSSAPEIYQHIIQQALHGCPGVRNISDDILLYGKDTDDHNQNLSVLMQRLQEKGLTLNMEKCIFGAPTVDFFGLVLSADGVLLEKKKVEAIREARAPTSAAEVRSFLGLATYCSRFISDFATIADPLRQLTRKSAAWEWTEVHQKAFATLKSQLTSQNVMAHYDPSASTQLRVDASPVGLGAVLTQTQEGQTRPVAYASRTLSDVERRYSQTEREALAVVWGCEKFHLYLYGTEFDLYTDHKPLEIIYSPRGKPPARIERWALRLQPYRFKIMYKPGSENPADVLSRLPISNQPYTERNIAEEYVNFVIANAVPKAIPLKEIQMASVTDPVLQQVRQSITSGSWSKDPTMRSYFNVRQELSIRDNLVLRGTRLVIPGQLQKRTLDLAHEGHQGIVKTKQLLRQKVWWPGIDHAVETLINHCLPCQAQGPKAAPEPLRMTHMPKQPWQVVHCDLCGPFPTGESLIVIVDECSRWPVVEITSSTTTATVIRRLDAIFSQFGIPEEIVTDNGPQLSSQEFTSYLKDHDIKHRRITPYWPAANAEVERFNRTLEKAIRAAHIEGRDWKQELNRFLLNYRATPHTSTNVPPAQLFFGRSIRTKVPQISLEAPNPTIVAAREHDRIHKARAKTYADHTQKAKPSHVKVGDRVLLRQQKRNKLSTLYDPRPYTVREKKGPSLILQRKNQPPIMRNASFVRKIPHDCAPQQAAQGDSDDEDIVVPAGAEQAPPRPARQRHAPVYLRDFVPA